MLAELRENILVPTVLIYYIKWYRNKEGGLCPTKSFYPVKTSFDMEKAEWHNSSGMFSSSALGYSAKTMQEGFSIAAKGKDFSSTFWGTLHQTIVEL